MSQIHEVRIRQIRQILKDYYGDQTCGPGDVLEEIEKIVEEPEDANEKLKELSAIQRLASACYATLLFYKPFTEEVRLEWSQITRGKLPTTKGLGDNCREALEAAGFPHWAKVGTGDEG